jgi:hypothetical protein
VADEMPAIHAERIEEAEGVGDERRPAIGAKVERSRGIAETAEVRCDDPVAGIDEDGDLMAPEKPRVGKAVQHEHRGASSDIDDRERLAGHLDSPADLTQVHPSTYSENRLTALADPHRFE